MYSNIFIFMTVTNNIYQKQIKYHVFNAVMNSELTELVLVFTIRPAFPTSVKKVNTSFKYVWRTWGPALPTLLADLMIFCPLCPISDEFQKLCYRRCYLSQVVTLKFRTSLVKRTYTCNLVEIKIPKKFSVCSSS